jgi:glycosyltransferase involved in cell wall biosynthesis
MRQDTPCAGAEAGGRVQNVVSKHAEKGPSQSPGVGHAIGYLGRSVDHLRNLTLLLDSTHREVVELPVSSKLPGFNRTPALLGWKPASMLWRRGHRVLEQLHGTHDQDFIRMVSQVVDEHELDCVIAYWSTQKLGDLMAIKRVRPKVKLILNLLCHPLGLTAVKVGMQNWHFRRSVGYLDGLIIPSEAMREYLERHVLQGHKIPLLIWPPYFAQHFFPKRRKEPCANTPNILFMGRMDYYHAQPSDDVRGFIDALLDQGVHTYHCEADGYGPHPKRHPFPYMTLPEAEEFATQFDASLILYNLEACQRTERFEVTVFDRLVASVTAGIPIAIPAQGYAASREYLKDYEAVIEFSSPAELAAKLADRQAMARLRAIARERSASYIGERRLGPLMDFLNRIVNV